MYVSSVAAISDIKRNNVLNWPTKSKTGKKPKGTFCQFDDVLCHLIVLVVMKDAPPTRAQNNMNIELHAKTRHEEEKIAKKKT